MFVPKKIKQMKVKIDKTFEKVTDTLNNPTY
jgi:hypothetical protein